MTGRSGATAIGFIAVLMWATLGPFGVAAGPVPPFLLVSLSFAIASAIGLVLTVVEGARLAGTLVLPWPAWLLGIAGLFGYHALYFAAIQNAPPVEANLINYLWPLLIVLFSGLLPGERLRSWHVLGAVSGLAGVAVLLLGGAEQATGGGLAIGYYAAVGSALAWSSYSVLSRRLGSIPTRSVAGFCLATAILSAAVHWLTEPTVWPDGPIAWAAVVGLGLGPVGGAFYVWDHGVKRGDIQVLGASAYAAPLLSTLLLIAFGLGEGSLAVWIACLLIVGGAVAASAELWTSLLKVRRP